MARNPFRSDRQDLRTQSAPRARFRPLLEQLEGRIVPSTWDGGGADNNWMTAANWVGDVAPQAGDNLVFPAGAAQTFPNINNFPAGTAFKGITIGAGDYRILGNGITLTTGIVSQFPEPNQSELQIPITLAAAQAFKASAGSNLYLNSPVNNNGFQLRVDAGDSTQVVFISTSAISGAGGLWKTGNGTVQIDCASSFAGGTTLSGGSLIVNDDNALGTGTLRLQTAAIGSYGPRTLANPVILSGTTTFGGASLTFAGPTTLTANRTLNVTGGDVTFTGPISESGGSFKLSKTGPGTLVLSGTNTFTGGVSVGAGTSGTLAVGSSSAVGPGTLTFYGGSLRADGAPRTLANPVTVAGDFNLYGTDFDLTLTGPVTLTGNRTLTANVPYPNMALMTITGVIGESGGSWQLRKNGGGTLLLSGNNTYSGGTKLLNGPLALGHNNALGTGPLLVQQAKQFITVLQADGGARTIDNPIFLNGTLYFGGAFDLTFAGPVTLTANRMLLWLPGGPNVVTFSGAIGESGGSFKLSTYVVSTLTLSGANTFSGGLTYEGQVGSGELALGNNSAAGAGTLNLLGTVSSVGGAHTLSCPVLIDSNIEIGGSSDLTFAGPVSFNGTPGVYVSNTGLTTFGGDLGGGNLITGGPGTIVLSGTTAYSGNITVSSGTLRADGSLPNSIFAVESGAVLAGSGTVGHVTVHPGGFLSPGDSPGILSTGDLLFNSTATFAVELNGPTAGVGYDQVHLNGAVVLGGTNLAITLGFTPAVGTSFTIIDNDGADAVSGTFEGLAEGATFTLNGFLFQISYKGGTGNDVVLTRIS